MYSTVASDELYCPHCGRSFKIEHDLNQHLASAHGLDNPIQFEKPFQCEECGKRFKSQSSKEQHAVSSHPEKFEQYHRICEYCMKVFNKHSNYIQHKEAHENGSIVLSKVDSKAETYYCSSCSKNFTSYRAFVVHSQTKHEEMLNIHVCRVCDRSFTSLHMMSKHECRPYEGATLFQCPNCPAVLPSETKYERHWHFTHNKHNLFNCRVCRKAFLDEKSLEQHLVSHKPGDEANFIHLCHFCDQLFDKRCNSEQHMRMYHAEYSEKLKRRCNKCKAPFTPRDKRMRQDICDFCIRPRNKRPCSPNSVDYPNFFKKL